MSFLQQIDNRFTFYKLLCIVFCLASCKSIIPKKNIANDFRKDTLQEILRNEDFFTTIKNERTIKTGQNYNRIVGRYYFGLQSEAQFVFKKYDIKKGINIREYHKYPTALFFAEGMYSIPEEKKQKAIEIFSPIIDSIFQNQAKEKTLKAEIIILGYTDETPYNSLIGSYQTIALSLKKSSLSQSEYENYISYFRAKELYEIITQIVSNKVEQLKFSKQTFIEIIAEGKGIEFPDATKKYKLIDDKRRITKVYWKVY